MNTTFPASYSTLSPLSLAGLISEKYEWTNVRRRFLVRGVGDTYLIETAEDRFILRIYRSSHRNLPQIKTEIELLLALQQAGVPVSYPVRDRSGEVIQALTAVEGPRYFVPFTYAPGKSVRTLTEEQLRVFGTNPFSSMYMPGE